MVLKFMTMNTSLADDESARPGGPVVQQAANGSRPKRKVKFLILLAVNIVVWIVVYNIWAGETQIPIWNFLTTNRGMVTGIMYNPENPCAIVHGEVVHEGDTVEGCRVVKICRDEVRFERDGEIFTKRVQ